MEFQSQKILPAARNLKSFEELLRSSYEYIILLEVHVAQLKNIGMLARKNHKKLFVHIDLIQGLNSDRYGVEFVCQEGAEAVTTSDNNLWHYYEKMLQTIDNGFTEG